MLIALGRAIGVLIAHADQRGGKARQRPRLGIQAGEDETDLNRGQRQPLFYPAEGVQPRGGFVRQLAVYQRGIALRQVAYRANAGVIPLRVKEVDKQNVRAQGGRPPGRACRSSLASAHLR